ncbi:MAG: hypothetical protein JXB48_02230 [Candidatus Latescibacteria bacterium]|nr:hypothetical protein [Candidatus Latescibacterota bacterium]
MKHKPEINDKRRAILKRGARFFFLGGIALLCGLFGMRKSRLSDRNFGCEIDLPCRECSKFNGCTISKAAETKASKESK